ncbi:hypothetical protein L1987_44883 [Smallanthus sonchifolius]|uniref:Uncharacterized protein n=1 Tax=Smallanthus sonchifolius TaxID=185202 RepID=A0ACB9GRF2_9ASTR|nr:hypothetical protein L1987_44883 [Smallanthus sonchifolius]
MDSLLKRTTFSSLRSHHQLLAKDPALERFKSYRKSASNIRRVGDYLTIAVVAGCCYEIYVRAVTREETRKALKSK